MSTKNIIAAMLLSLLAMPVWSQGYNHGLGNEDEETQSIGKRLLHLENKSKAFQVYLNLNVGTSVDIDKEDGGMRFLARHIRPEILGRINKWGYRLRLNLAKDNEYNSYENTSDIVDIVNVYFYPNKHWQFSLGRKPLNYGTFEYDWNPLHVLQYFEFQYNQPDISAYSITGGYTTKGHTITYEIANASTKHFYDKYPNAKETIEKSRHPLQYSTSWHGNMFNNHLETLWSYTVRNDAKKCFTHLIMLGTAYKTGPWHFRLDYNCAIGKMDYLGIINDDALKSNKITESDIITNTHYNQVTLDIGYHPSKHWNFFVKGGVNFSSTTEMEDFKNYRRTFEYMAAAQYFPDVTQDLRVSLAYIGKTVDYKKNIGLNNFSTNRIDLSLIYRIKAF